MKKLLIALPLLMVSCKKKEVTPTTPTTCNCYKSYYHQVANGNYYLDSQSEPFVDLCAKDGMVEYSGVGMYKTVWTCN